MDLATATTEDMVAELERRGFDVALIVAPKGRPQMGEMSTEELPRRVFGDSFASRDPAFLAAFFCDGVQPCLNQIETEKTAYASIRGKEMKVSAAAALSIQVGEIKRDLAGLLADHELE
jgi:hypothetical protein